MNFQIPEQLEKAKGEFREFVEKEICPDADANDRNEKFPIALIRKIAAKGFLGASISREYGGSGWDQLKCGILMEEIGRGCSSARSLLTSHLSLVSQTIQRCGTNGQKQYWLPQLVIGKRVGAFCLTESDAGSDTQNISGSYVEDNGAFILNCSKKWVTFGQAADVFLVFARNKKEVSAFLIDKQFPGVVVTPLKGMLGLKAAMLANIDFKEVRVPKDRLLGAKGFGLLQVMNTALDNGRYSVTLGSLGIAKAALKASIEFAKTRKQFNSYLKDHQLTKRKITEMVTKVQAASLLCYQVGTLRDSQHSTSIIQGCVAKYYTTTITSEITKETVQLHGAYGCSEDSPVQRYFRDAKIMEIIEGTSEIQQILIADEVFTNPQLMTDY